MISFSTKMPLPSSRKAKGRGMPKQHKGSGRRGVSDVGHSVTAGPGTRFNYGPLENQLGYLLRRAQIAVFRDFFAVFNEFDIRPAEYSVLTVIECNPGL